jgi:hypothetical protein
MKKKVCAAIVAAIIIALFGATVVYGSETGPSINRPTTIGLVKGPAGLKTANTVRASAYTTPAPPVTDLRFWAEGNTVKATWVNPDEPFYAVGIGVRTDGMRGSAPVSWGTGGSSFVRGESWEGTVPLGGVYTVDVYTSRQDVFEWNNVYASTIVTAPVTITSSLARSGRHYRDYPFLVRFGVPGDPTFNMSTWTPTSWSARMADIPLFGWGRPKVSVKRWAWSSKLHRYFWANVGTYYTGYLAYGYPSSAKYTFHTHYAVARKGTTFRLVMYGTLAPGFIKTTGGRSWTVTRFIKIYH